MTRAAKPSKVPPLWLALGPALTALASAGTLGYDDNFFPTWVEAVLLVLSVGLVAFIFGANLRQRRHGQGDGPERGIRR